MATRTVDQVRRDADAKQIESSWARWFNLDETDLRFLTEAIVKEYNKVQDSSDGSAIFPGELEKLILRVAMTNDAGEIDV